MKRVLVTGATGFIGSHLTRALKEANCHVTAVIEPGVNAQTIKPFCDTLETHDLRLKEGMERFSGKDVIFHLAARVTERGPYEDFKAPNVDATKNLYEAAFRAGCGRFLFLSSLSVHSFKDRVNAGDAEPVDNLAFGYTRPKVECEQFLSVQSRLAWTIVRPGFWVFGPGEVKTLPLLRRVLKTGVVFWPKAGRKKICASYVENLVDAVMLAAFSDKTAGKTLIAADDNELTWKEILESAARLLNKKIKIFSISPWAFRFLSAYLAEVASHDCHFRASSLLYELGWRPKTDFASALEKSLKW